MFRIWLTVTYETYLRLLRDRFFVPGIISGALMAGFATIASTWGVEEYDKILTDICLVSFHLTGVFIAIIWGTKTVSDTQAEGSIEVQLASPISRPIWLLGKFSGITIILTILASIYMIILQGILFFHSYGLLRTDVFISLLFVFLLWLIIASMTIFFASIASAPIALFSSSCLWLIGLLSQPLYQTISSNATSWAKASVEVLASIWNLHLFNFSSFIMTSSFPSPTVLFYRLSLGIIYVVFFLSASCLLNHRKDIK